MVSPSAATATTTGGTGKVVNTQQGNNNISQLGLFEQKQNVNDNGNNNNGSNNNNNNSITATSYPSLQQLDRFTANLQQYLSSHTSTSEEDNKNVTIPQDYNTILLCNVDTILQDIFTTSFTPLLESLQQQWLPLFNYKPSTAANTPQNNVNTRNGNGNNNNNNNNNNNSTTTLNNIDLLQNTNNNNNDDDINQRLHTQPITAIIDLHISSFQKLLDFHSNHRQDRITKIQGFIDHWVNIITQLRRYCEKLSDFYQNGYVQKYDELENELKKNYYLQK
eukprot:UN02490